MVAPTADLMTDESAIYKTVGSEFVNHQKVKRAPGQYVHLTAGQ